LLWIARSFLSGVGLLQAAAPRLIAGRHDWQTRVRARIAANLAALRALAARAPELGLLLGGAGWAAIVRLPARRTGEAWALELLRNDVAVNPGDFYDLEGEAYVVSSLIVEPEMFRTGLERMERVVSEARA
jgi:hypothetical protein